MCTNFEEEQDKYKRDNDKITNIAFSPLQHVIKYTFSASDNKEKSKKGCKCLYGSLYVVQYNK